MVDSSERWIEYLISTTIVCVLSSSIETVKTSDYAAADGLSHVYIVCVFRLFLSLVNDSFVLMHFSLRLCG